MQLIEPLPVLTRLVNDGLEKSPCNIFILAILEKKGSAVLAIQEKLTSCLWRFIFKIINPYQMVGVIIGVRYLLGTNYALLMYVERRAIFLLRLLPPRRKV